MSIKTDIRDALITICGKAGGGGAFIATVDSVSVLSRSCSVTTTSGDVETELPNVWLMADIDDGQLIIPKVGSSVIVAYNEKMQPFVLMFSEIDSVCYVVGSSQFKITDGLIQANDGSNGGMVKVIELTTKLNNLENLVNGFIALYNAHTHPYLPGPGPVAPTSVTASLETNTLTPTVRANIEDTKFKH